MFSTVELASIYHPPLLGALPNTAMVLSRKGPPPRNLPTSISDPDICTFGTVNYRDLSTKFGIKRFDRRRHLYVVGKSGSGKSCLMQLLVRNDMDRGLGCAVIDPHGDLIDDIMKLVPKHRVQDVVVFDPSDVNFPASFNPMDPVRPELRVRVALSFLDSFKRVFGGDWCQKMDHVLRYAMLGLLAVPGSNILSLRRMLSDEQFRGEVVRRASDESVKRFWLRDFMARRQEFEEGPMSRLLNRLDELLASENIRNILGQSQNAFNFRSFMDSRKIVLIKISKGVLGSENATLLGTLIIWKIYEAAMSRADMPAEDRKDFFLYVDEFQNFATESFTEILSESRKYNLSLTFANQYLGQLPSNIRKTVFGNVANILSFRVGSDDAGIVSPEFKPLFGDEDLLNLPLREFYLKMSIDGQVQDSFSGRTIDLKYPSDKENYAEECLAHSRKTYCKTLEQVTSLPQKKKPTPAGAR
jgi:ABC-type oligopeptide transport system ATPase subunit